MMFLLGVDRLIAEKSLQSELKGKRVALVGHPASVTHDLCHSLDALSSMGTLQITSAFGPQHGMRGEKQDNMIESDDFQDPRWKIPVFSLYGRVRRPTAEMMDSFDVVLVDLLDVGTRIYTYVTTLLYIMEEAAKYKKAVWVLDRPNPAGRPIEGTILKPGFESFVGASPIMMRHGLTMGELALFFRKKHKLDVELKIIEMRGYDPTQGPGYGWPTGEIAWVNPSPNIPTLCTARAFPGTVMLEGTNLSEGRGTTRPLQMFGAPKIDAEAVLKEMHRRAPEWMKGCRVRTCYFEPTFHKFKGELCAGLQIHVDDPAYRHEEFKPYRQMLLFFKVLQNLQPALFAWRQPPYEYEKTRLPIDLLTGGSEARNWVDDPQARPEDLEKVLGPEEKQWAAERKEFLLYPA